MWALIFYICHSKISNILILSEVKKETYVESSVLAPGCTCTRYFQKNLANWKLIEKFRNKSRMYLTMLRTTMIFFAPKRHSMLPGGKRQISDSKFKFSDLICCQKFVFFPQGAYDVFSVRNLSRWCVAYSGTCMIFFGIFWPVFVFLYFFGNTGSRCSRAPKWMPWWLY